MTRLHRRVCFSEDDRPQFFKVFIPKFNSTKMSLPPAFVRKFIPKTLESTIVRDCRGRTWEIAVLIREDNVYFDNGWDDFAKEQLLDFGDFLLFTYSAMYVLFEVEIFGKNGCKKESTAVPKALGLVKIEPEEMVCQESGVNGSTKRLGSSEEIRAKRRETISENCEVLMNLQFSVTINEEKASRWIAIIPSAVVKEVKFKPNTSLRCQSTKLWPIKISMWCDGCGAITTGWPNFCEDNSLKKNDECVFELVLGKGNVCEEIKVRIIRGRARRTR